MLINQNKKKKKTELPEFMVYIKAVFRRWFMAIKPFFLVKMKALK